MKALFTFCKNVFITVCAFTHTTELFTRFTGVGTFLPQLFALRFANVLCIPASGFEIEMRQCRSFKDDKWTAYWRAKADTHLREADARLNPMGAPVSETLLRDPSPAVREALGNALHSAAPVFTDRSPDTIDAMLESFAADPDRRDAAHALNALVLAVGYLTIASWPGWTPARMKAYWDARRLFEALAFAMAPSMDMVVEKIRIEVQGEVVDVFAGFPKTPHKVPAVLMTNGLEGSMQELLLPTLKYRKAGLAVVAMEMPGTFAYKQPMSADSEGIYRAVIDQIARHPRLQADKIGIFGASFGAYWSTRMAAVDKRITAVVSNGGPYHRSFSPKATFGMPAIILDTMAKTVNAKHKLDLGKKLHDLSIRHRYKQITQPLLAINGDRDTLLSTQDTIDLARETGGTLLLYPGDDHCAMAHYVVWQKRMSEWLKTQLQTPNSP